MRKNSEIIRAQWLHHTQWHTPHCGLLSLVLAFAMMGCTADTNIESEVNGEAVLFTSSFGSGMTRSSTIENIWTPSHRIAVSDGTNVYSYEPSGTSAGSGESIRLNPATTDTFYWPVLRTGKTFMAWYQSPYSATPPSKISVPADQSTNSLDAAAYAALDKLYAEATVEYKSAVPLRFYHQPCRVIVIVNSSSTETKEYVNNVRFGTNNVALTRAITKLGATGGDALTGMTTTAWGSISDTGNSITMRRTGADDSNSVYTFECILPPQSGGNTTTNLLTITTATRETPSKSKTYEYLAAFDLQAGYKHVYNIAVSARSVVNIITEDVSDWGLTEQIGEFSATVPTAGY